ncbi:MAG: hypothetical protein JJ975_09390 [Bacteroidia bacterium]|nr:hypothetical protein [Bacteroidia bacterium]
MNFYHKLSYQLKAIILLVFALPVNLLAQPEEQISFAQEFRPHSYYVDQAEQWAKELQKDSLSEKNWYNYFRSCRNAQGTADWRTDFVNESPYLMEGGKVVETMERYIPTTFTYKYLSYLTQGIGTGNADNLLEAFEMKPNFPGIHSSVVSYAVSSGNSALRKEANEKWYKTNYLSAQLLNYGHNLLTSVDSNAILFVQHDNDTYPVYMLQDALDYRTDVLVISIDFLLLPEYREPLFNMLNLPPLEKNLDPDINEYRLNWQKVVAHILLNYNGNRPLYPSMTLFNELYKDFEPDLYVSGLALRYCRDSIDTKDHNIDLFENKFLLDYLKHHFYTDRNQQNVNYQNLNYISCFKLLFDRYTALGNKEKALKVREIAIDLADQIGNEHYIQQVQKYFEK